VIKTLNLFHQIYNKNKLKIRFLLAGGVNTLFGLGCFPVLFIFLKDLNFHYLFVLILSQLSGITFSYITNKFFVFQTSRNYIKEFARFASFYLIFSIVNIFYLPIMVEFIKMTPIVSQLLFSVIIILSSYFWHKHISFKRKDINYE